MGFSFHFCAVRAARPGLLPAAVAVQGHYLTTCPSITLWARSCSSGRAASGAGWTPCVCRQAGRHPSCVRDSLGASCVRRPLPRRAWGHAAVQAGKQTGRHRGGSTDGVSSCGRVAEVAAARVHPSKQAPSTAGWPCVHSPLKARLLLQPLLLRLGRMGRAEPSTITSLSRAATLLRAASPRPRLQGKPGWCSASAPGTHR